MTPITIGNNSNTQKSLESNEITLDDKKSILNGVSDSQVGVIIKNKKDKTMFVLPISKLLAENPDYKFKIKDIVSSDPSDTTGKTIAVHEKIQNKINNKGYTLVKKEEDGSESVISDLKLRVRTKEENKVIKDIFAEILIAKSDKSITDTKSTHKSEKDHKDVIEEHPLQNRAVRFNEENSNQSQIAKGVSNVAGAAVLRFMRETRKDEEKRTEAKREELREFNKELSENVENAILDARESMDENDDKQLNDRKRILHTSNPSLESPARKTRKGKLTPRNG